MITRILVKVLLLLAAASAAALQSADVRTAAGPANQTPVLVIHGIGRGVAKIDGHWQFRTGDDLKWAAEDFDDSGWEPQDADAPWGVQQHPSYVGFAWYRRHIDILPTSNMTGLYEVLIPHAEDAYEVYWNGKRMGTYGRVPPHAMWYYNAFPRSFPLEGSAVGVLAIRVWKAPLDAFAPADAGGLFATPLVGDPETISLREQSITWTYIRSDLYDYSLILLRCFIAILCGVLWSRNRREPIFLWVGLFTLTPVALEILQHLFLFPISYALARCINQPIYVTYGISLWFLLAYLLQLNERPQLMRWIRAIAWVNFTAGILDGVLAIFWASAGPAMQWTDGVLDTFILSVEVVPLFLIVVGLRRRIDTSRWAVALAAFVLQLLHTIADASALGQRYTHWTLFSDMIDIPLFTVQGVEFQLEKVTSIVLFAAIIFALYRYILEQQARRTALEQEMRSAREIQQILIPETLPSLPGYSITSAYTPAQEVGGDFFQILPCQGGATVIALGDVSGKGLKAAMNVSMIVGVLRTQANASSSPAEILGALNRCLTGRMQGGFATAIVLRLEDDGAITFANAGHLPPFLNGKELWLEASLPLGLIAYNYYSELSVKLRPGDHLSLYTDGLLEAKSKSNELFGFERMHSLFANRPTAQQASEAAIAFGQDDDVTVLTLTRLAAGEESTTSLVAPVLEEIVETS